MPPQTATDLFRQLRREPLHLAVWGAGCFALALAVRLPVGLVRVAYGNACAIFGGGGYIAHEALRMPVVFVRTMCRLNKIKAVFTEICRRSLDAKVDQN